MLRQIGFISLLFLASTATANTNWVAMNGSEASCSATCSRAQLENVTTPDGSASVCAVGYDSEYYPGTYSNGANQRCRAHVGKDGKLVLGRGKSARCLCATDGENKRTDYAWITFDKKAATCSATCAAAAPKYSYAVYSSYGKDWFQVCASSLGEIGYKVSGESRCSTTQSEGSFGCLCTQMFSGDLDAKKDP